MIPKQVVETLNDIRFSFLSANEMLGSSSSFRSLVSTSPALRDAMQSIFAVAAKPRLAEPCDGRVTCAIIGSSGHGKTTIMDEIFPGLSERGWLVTDVTDTTSQSLRIQYADPGSDDLREVTVNSWSAQEIKDLMSHTEVQEQNEKDNIKVSYLAEGVQVDGTDATFNAEDAKVFQFARKIDLLPFPEPFRVPPKQAGDPRFIRALTVKEQSAVLDGKPVLSVARRQYDALQLRAVVKDVSLRDDYERLGALSGRPGNDLGGLTFVDTPGLAVNGSVKDEVLRHFLEKKSHHIALQLWKHDELDVVIHLVLCGRQSDFAVLWKDIERELGPAEMDDLAERLVLAVNGMNIYFTNRDVKKKYEDPATAEREGDQFATTLEDNILQKMSPRGRVRPAKVVFLDSQSIVETQTSDSYERAYEQYRPVMEKWVDEDGIGHATLKRLGLVESFKENIGALCDPDDRGQGLLMRSLLEVVEAKGPKLLIKKYLVRTGMLAAIEDLSAQLELYYDAEGRMSRAAVREALRGCLAFLDREDLASIERFAVEHLDGRIDEIVPRHGEIPADWVVAAFHEMCRLLKDCITHESGAPADVEAEFNRHFDAVCQGFAERWGYATADFKPPDKGFTNSADLVTHCLRVHAREILYHLLLAEDESADGGGFEQGVEDQQLVRNVMGMLAEARLQATAACAEHGVDR